MRAWIRRMLGEAAGDGPRRTAGGDRSRPLAEGSAKWPVDRLKRDVQAALNREAPGAMRQTWAGRRALGSVREDADGRALPDEVYGAIRAAEWAGRAG